MGNCIQDFRNKTYSIQNFHSYNKNITQTTNEADDQLMRLQTSNSYISSQLAGLSLLFICIGIIQKLGVFKQTVHIVRWTKARVRAMCYFTFKCIFRW